MVIADRPKPPNRICLFCIENIVDSLDAHMETCPKNNGGHHVLWKYDLGNLPMQQEAKSDD